MTRALYILLLFVAIDGCAKSRDRVGKLEQPIEGREGTWEFAADAPWRMEPAKVACTAGPCLVYDAIPIQIAIHDANIEHLKPTYTAPGSLDQPAPIGIGTITRRRLVAVQSITITELPSGTVRTFGLGDLHEIEFTTGKWRVQRWPKPAPPRTVCRPWAGDDCQNSGAVEDTSQWHGTLMYTPTGFTAPGVDMRLKIEVHVSQRDLAGQVDRMPEAVLVQHVSVHYGEAPLPRFSDNWAYGDLHYHSQGTDNEGESAHSYRNVVYALSAIGLDFTFATDHASASEKIMSIETGFTNPKAYEDTLRDTDELRFKESLAMIADADRAVTSYPRLVRPGRLRVPQLFLGGEVDIIPETTAGEYLIPYGNGQLYDVNSCAYPALVELLALDDHGGCGNQGPSALIVAPGDGRWLIKDLQGVADPSFFARQHLVHLPFDSGNPDGFVASHTSMYGGATRRLKELFEEEDAQHKGVLFLAHPLSGASGSGFGRMAAPDLVPFSPAQLDEALASPHVLGLQLWNEDARLHSGGVHTGAAGLQGVVSPFVSDTRNEFSETSNELPSTLHHGAFTWDTMLRRGMSESLIASLPWLAPGQPRRVFMAGGSDAHGDLNYRRTGYMVEEIDGFTDTAMGKPRNLVFTGAPRGAPLASNHLQATPLSQQQVVAGLQSGQFSVTDGPALNIAWDVNRSGHIDDGDVPMGGQLDYDTQPPPLLVEWLSTAEFGPVSKIDLYIGVRNEELDRDLTYAPDWHGPRGEGMPVASSTLAGARTYTDPTTNRKYVKLQDGYWSSLDGPSLHLEITTPQEGMAGSWSLIMDPAQFPVGVMNDATSTLDRVRTADRFYVRAFAMTKGRQSYNNYCNTLRGECLPRFAYSNPVWARSQFPSPTGRLTAVGGKCLDESWQRTVNGTTVLTWDCHGQPSQRWSWHPDTGVIVGTGVNKRLDVFGFDAADGAAVGIWDRDGAINQKWRFNDMQIRQAGLALAVFSSSQAEGAAVGMWDPIGYPDQKWRLTDAGEIRGFGDK